MSTVLEWGNLIVKPIRRMFTGIMTCYSTYNRAVLITLIVSVISGLCVTMPTWAEATGRKVLSLNGNDWLIYSGLPDDSNGITTTTAAVPGNIQSDLERQHFLDPLSYGAGDPRLIKVCQKDWWYKKSFMVPSDFSGQRTVLVFDGVDWSCQVWLNEQLLGSHAGMFRRFEFDISNAILPGRINTLVVKLDKMPDEILPYLIGSDGKVSGGGTDYFFVNGLNKTRQILKDLKSPTNFSYDWGTNIWALGIWKDVRIEATGPARIEWIQVQSQLTDDYKNATVSVKLEINSIANIGAAKAKFRLTGNGADIRSVTDITLSDGNNMVSGQIKLGNPALWWPNGYGEHPLYTVESSLEKADGSIIDTKFTRFGIRELKWGQVTGAPADFIVPYRLYVNGKPIRMIGCALFPDLLPGNEMISGPKHIQLAHDAHINTLRMNGGGGVLPEGMWDLADELGIMVQMEFPIANCLPESDEVFLKNLEDTARNIVKQLRNHPSIIEWDGGNEMCFWQGQDHPALHIFEKVTAQEDDKRFIASDAIQGGRHGPYQWVPATHYTHWNDPNIKLHAGDFPMMSCGEYGAQSPANLEVWYRDIPLPSQWPIIPERDCSDPTMIRKNILNGVGLYEWLAKGTIDSLFGKAKNLNDMVQGGQFIGAEGLRSAADALRRRGSTLGSMITHVFNEPWPNGAGSFHVDYDGVPLMSYYWLTEAFEPVSISLKYYSITYSQIKGIDTELWVVSDMPKVSDSLIWKYTVRTSDGAVVEQGDGKVNIAPQECLKVRDIHINPPANLGLVFVELQLCDSSNKILTERVHIFGLDGVTGVFGGLLNNATSDGNIPEVPSYPANFAYVGNGAKPATASSTIPAEKHQWDPDVDVYKAEYINDGCYGTNSVWTGNKSVPGYVPMPYFQIDLGKVCTVGRFKIGRDRSGRSYDRPMNYMKIESSPDANTWTSIFEKADIQAIAGYTPTRTLEITTQPIEARYLKVTVGEGGAGVDEFEVYAPQMPLPAQLPAVSITDLPSWAVPVKKTSLTAKVSSLPVSDGKESTKFTLTNTGQMTALFCQLKPMLAYRTDLFLSNNFIIVPPGQSREIIVKSPINSAYGLTLSQTGWRIYSWNADDVVINPSNEILFSFGRADSMCREYKGYADANTNDSLGQYTVTVSGVRPDASLIPWIVTAQSKLRCIVNVSKLSTARGAVLYINTADQSNSVTTRITASVNGVRFTTLLPNGLGKQNAIPYYLGYPYTAKIYIPAGVLKNGENVIEIRSENGWFTWDACYLVTAENTR